MVPDRMRISFLPLGFSRRPLSSTSTDCRPPELVEGRPIRLRDNDVTPEQDAENFGGGMEAASPRRSGPVGTFALARSALEGLGTVVFVTPQPPTSTIRSFLSPSADIEGMLVLDPNEARFPGPVECLNGPPDVEEYRPVEGTGKRVGVVERKGTVGIELDDTAEDKLPDERRDCGRRVPPFAALWARGLLLTFAADGDAEVVEADIERNPVGTTGLGALRFSV